MKSFFFCSACIYRFRFIRAYIKPEPNQISLAFVSLETPVAEEKKKYGSYRGGADFSCPIITELRKICCNFPLNPIWAQAESTVHMLNWAIRSVKFLGVEFD